MPGKLDLIPDEEIDVLIQNMEQLGRDPVAAMGDGRLLRFVEVEFGSLLRLLRELQEWRRAGGEHGGDGKGVCRTILEGYSEESGQDALSRALDKAAHYFSEQHDVSITVLSLVALPGGGHRATIEVHLTPLTLRNRAGLKGADIEVRRINDHDYHHRRKLATAHLDHMVFDHFAAKKGSISPLPGYFMINITDSALLNDMLERQFLRAGSVPPVPTPSGIHHILVRTHAPDEAPELD